MPTESANSQTPLRLDGGLDIQNAERLRAVLLEQLDSSAPGALDLAGVTTCDTAGLQLLCAARRSASALNREWQLANPPPALFKACEEIGLSPKELGL